MEGLSMLGIAWYGILAQAGGEAPAGGGGAPPGAGGLFQLLPMFMIIFMIFYFLIIRPEGKKRRERQKMVSAVKKGDIVVTTGGLIGKVWRVDDAEVVMIIDKDRDVKAHFQKGAIYDVVKASEGAPAPEVAARPDVKSDQPSTR